MSPSPIPSPCGIPLIFSSVQIRLYSSSFGCYCYRSASKSNSSRLIWSYFHMQDLAGGCWWFCGRNKQKIPWTGDGNILFSNSFFMINVHQHQWHHSFVCNYPVKSAQFPLNEQLFCVWCPSAPSSSSPLLSEMFCWLINSGQPSDQWLWWADRPRAGHWTRPDLCLCRSLAFVIAA